MPTLEQSMITEARRVARLLEKQKTLKRQMTEVSAELRLARRNLKALAGAKQAGDPLTPPMRLFGERQ